MGNRNLKRFGIKVKKYRQIKGYTQLQLAEKLGLSANFVGMIERGERNTSVDNVYLIASALDISADKLFEK